MSHYETHECGRCINGVVFTGVGRKPCPYCMGKGYIVIEVEDEDDVSYTPESYSGSTDSSGGSWSNDSDDDRNKDSNFRPLGCLTVIAVIYLLYKYTSVFASFELSIEWIVAIIIAYYVAKKLMFKS